MAVFGSASPVPPTDEPVVRRIFAVFWKSYGWLLERLFRLWPACLETLGTIPTVCFCPDLCSGRLRWDDVSVARV